MKDGDGVEKMPLIGGHPALDFANSMEYRGRAGEMNHLANYDQLVRWAALAGLLSASEAGRLRAAARQDKASAIRVWQDLMGLRDSIFAVFLARAQQRAAPAKDLEVVNNHLKQAYANRRLQIRGEDVRWVWAGERSELRRVQWEISHRAAELLTGAKIDRVRKCAKDPCDWLFLDSSRSGRRRWCRMETCGNIAKLRRFRAKRQLGRGKAA